MCSGEPTDFRKVTRRFRKQRQVDLTARLLSPALPTRRVCNGPSAHKLPTWTRNEMWDGMIWNAVSNLTVSLSFYHL